MGLTHINNLKDHFPLGFTSPIDYKGKWSISESGNYLERKAHPGRETIGDMKVYFEALFDDEHFINSLGDGNNLCKDRMHFTAIGK